MTHHHHHQLINHRVEHDHDLDDHDDVFRHSDHVFGDYDLLFGPACYDHHLKGSVERHHTPVHADGQESVEDDGDRP